MFTLNKLVTLNIFIEILGNKWYYEQRIRGGTTFLMQNEVVPNNGNGFFLFECLSTSSRYSLKGEKILWKVSNLHKLI